jgi:hypothetical protein
VTARKQTSKQASSSTASSTQGGKKVSSAQILSPSSKSEV